jgi:hypothetical protein
MVMLLLQDFVPAAGKNEILAASRCMPKVSIAGSPGATPHRAKKSSAVRQAPAPGGDEARLSLYWVGTTWVRTTRGYA